MPSASLQLPAPAGARARVARAAPPAVAFVVALALLIPTAAGASAAPAPAPWRCTYWNNTTLSGTPALRTTQATIGFVGPQTAPAALGVANWSAQFLAAPQFAAGTYAFTLSVDDGARLWVDGLLLVDRWAPGPLATFVVDDSLAAGSHQVRLQYLQRAGGESLRLTWAPVAPAPPASVSAPVLAGAAEVGASLSASTGSWTNRPTAYSFRWQRDQVDIPGATAASYTVAPDDASHRLDAVVTATNAAGSASAASAATLPVPTPASLGGRSDAGLSWGWAYEATYLTETPAQRSAALAAMVAAGVDRLRVDVPYTTDPSVWWSQPIVTDAVAAHLHVDALLDDWDPSATPEQVGAFAGLAARHYAPLGVDTFEIGNEPNLGGAVPADAAAYTRDLQAAYLAVKAVEPGATVLVGGLAPAATDGRDIAPIDFLTRLYAAGGAGSFDAMNMHPYSYPDQPMQADLWNPFANLPAVHQVMADHGDGAKAVWITEYGAPTAGDPAGNGSVSEAAQAQMITAAFAALHQWSWAGPLFVFNWIDSADGAFGLLRRDGTAKPSLTALATRS